MPPHDNGDLASRIASTTGPPLASVDDIVVALGADLALHVGGIRRSHGWLCGTHGAVKKTKKKKKKERKKEQKKRGGRGR